MQKKTLYDITEVCRMLGITSRTLRFYEEKGIVQSTTDGYSARRRYSREQIANVRNVLILRTLGLSVKTVRDLQKNGTDLREAVLFRRAEIYASIEKKTRELYRLNEALSVIEAGGDLLGINLTPGPSVAPEDAQIVQLCTEAIVTGDTETLYTHLSPGMLKHMPREIYEEAREETLLPLGKFVAYENTEADPLYPSRIYRYVKYSSMGLKITFVFHNGKIDGMWLSYYDTKEKEAI